MFDDDEVKEVREGRDNWLDYSHKKTVVKSRLSRKRLGGTIAVSIIIIVLMVSIMFTTGVSLAGSLGSVGGFQAQFPMVVGNDMKIYPALGQSSACKNNVTNSQVPKRGEEALPVLKADIKNATLKSEKGGPISFEKDIQVPNPVPDSINVVRVEMTQGHPKKDSNIGDMSVQLTNLSAEMLRFRGGASLIEQFSNGSSTYPIWGPGGGYSQDRNFDFGEFHIDGDKAMIKNGRATAVFVGFSKLNLRQFELNLKYNPDNPHVVKDGCPI
ncbi:MAG: hypothetical protein ABEK59_06550 [Halobacteria archaeon]